MAPVRSSLLVSLQLRFCLGRRSQAGGWQTALACPHVSPRILCDMSHGGASISLGASLHCLSLISVFHHHRFRSGVICRGLSKMNWGSDTNFLLFLTILMTARLARMDGLRIIHSIETAAQATPEELSASQTMTYSKGYPYVAGRKEQ